MAINTNHVYPASNYAQRHYNPKWETYLFWNDNPKRFVYLRELVVETPLRAGAITRLCEGGLRGTVICCSELRKDAPKNRNGKYLRRVWWLDPACDTYPYPGDPPGGCTIGRKNAIKVSSIKAGEYTEKAMRRQGRKKKNG